MSKQEFHVVAAHSIVFSTVIKVEASSDEEAMELASRMIGDTKPEDWRGEAGGHIQRPYVVEAIPVDELETDDEDARDVVMEGVRFMSMRANINAGEGIVLVQPWFEEKSSTMQIDLVQDWIAQLSELPAALGKSSIS